MSGNNAYSSYQYEEGDDDDQYHEVEVEDNLEYDNNLDDSTYQRKRNFIAYEEYELDAEDERLIREELGDYDPDNNQSHIEQQEEEETFDDITEDFLLSKINELNKLAIQIDVLSFGGDQQEIEDTRAEMDDIVAYICKVTRVKRSIENYIKSDNKRMSSSLPSLFIDLKADIRKLFHSEQSILVGQQQTSFIQEHSSDGGELRQRDTKHYNSVADQETEEYDDQDEEEYEERSDDDQGEQEYQHDEEEEEEEDDEHGEKGSDQEELQDEPYEPYEPTYYEDNVDYTLDAEDDQLSDTSEEDSEDINQLESLRDQCMKKSIELIQARNEREKALTIYHVNEMTRRDPKSKERIDLVQQLTQNCLAELTQLNKEIERFSKETIEIRKLAEQNKPIKSKERKKVMRTPEKKKIERIEHMSQDVTTPRANKDAQVMLTPSQLKERQENSDLQNMYNRLEASLSRTPQSKSIPEERQKPNKPKQPMLQVNNITKSNDPNLSMEPSKEKKMRPVSSSGVNVVGASLENPRKKAAERLKEKKQMEKEQREREELEKAEKLKKLEEICHKQQAIIHEEHKALTTKKYLEEILSDDSDEERLTEIEEEERRRTEEEKIAEARRKAILRAKEKKKREIEREREMEEERRKKEAEKWKKRDEGLMAFKLKQEMEKEKKMDVRSSKPAMPPAQPILKPKPTKPPSQKPRKSTANTVADSPLLDGLDPHDNDHDYLQFSPPPPMFSTIKPKK